MSTSVLAISCNQRSFSSSSHVLKMSGFCAARAGFCARRFAPNGTPSGCQNSELFSPFSEELSKFFSLARNNSYFSNNCS